MCKTDSAELLESILCSRTEHVHVEQRRSGLTRGGGLSERVEVEAGGVESGHEARVRRGGLAVRDGRRPERVVRAGGADGAHAPPQAPRARARALGARQHTLCTRRVARFLHSSALCARTPRIITSTVQPTANERGAQRR